MPYKDPLNLYLNRKAYYQKIRLQQEAYLKEYVKKNKAAISLRKKLWHMAKQQNLTEEERAKKRLATKTWTKKNEAYVRTYAKIYRTKNKAKLKEAYRKQDLRRKYGLTPVQFQNMLEAQDFCCAICLKKFGRDRYGDVPHVDHCHQTKHVRGLLCHKCNRALGLFNDNSETLIKALNYLAFSHL